MSIKRNIFNTVSDLLIAIMGLNKPFRFYRAFLARIDARKTVTVRGEKIEFDANKELHLLRANTLNSKEPETLDWIDGFAKDSVFYDVGANIGVFSLYAAKKQNCKVIALEPESQNYACLNRNIFLNRCAEKITALNLGLYDETGLDVLNMQNMESGAALHSLGVSKGWSGKEFIPVYKQAVLSFEMDRLVEMFKLPKPNYIKIDVDGNEKRILKGAKETLKSDVLRSLLVEMREDDKDIPAILAAAGFMVIEKRRAQMQGEKDNLVNAIFIKQE